MTDAVGVVEEGCRAAVTVQHRKHAQAVAILGPSAYLATITVTSLDEHGDTRTEEYLAIGVVRNGEDHRIATRNTWQECLDEARKHAPRPPSAGRHIGSNGVKR